MVLYVIRNRISGQEYVGTTTRSLALRLSDHRHRALVGTRRSPLYAAIRQHGWDSFTVETIAVAESYDALLQMERQAIAERGTMAPNGYNLVEGGRGNFGWRMSEETKRKIAAKATGRKGSMLGRKMTQEQITKRLAHPKTERQRESARAASQSAESRAKISAAAKARWANMTPEAKAAHLAALKSRAANATAARKTPEVRARLAENKRQWWATRTDAQRAAHVAAMTHSSTS